jgi:hypothetical protein
LVDVRPKAACAEQVPMIPTSALVLRTASMAAWLVKDCEVAGLLPREMEVFGFEDGFNPFA